MTTLITLIIFLAILAGVTAYVKSKDGEIIISSIGGFMLGLNVIIRNVEDEQEVEEDEEIVQYFIHISLLFISLTFIWYVEK